MASLQIKNFIEPAITEHKNNKASPRMILPTPIPKLESLQGELLKIIYVIERHHQSENKSSKFVTIFVPDLPADDSEHSDEDELRLVINEDDEIIQAGSCSDVERVDPKEIKPIEHEIAVPANKSVEPSRKDCTEVKVTKINLEPGVRKLEE